MRSAKGVTAMSTQQLLCVCESIAGPVLTERGGSLKRCFEHRRPD
jgi:hypothetical protein